MTATKNYILAAEALLDHGPHCMLVGQETDNMSKKLGLKTVANNYFTTAFRKVYREQKVRLGNKDTAASCRGMRLAILTARFPQDRQKY